MDANDTLALMAQARRGDQAAWTLLLERYYSRWLQRFHGDLGSTIRRLYDTQDLVQSAIGDAMRDLPHLRNDAAFFVWVTSILRHKLAQRRRELERERREPLAWQSGTDGQAPRAANGTTPEEPVNQLESYLETLDALLDLFPHHPEPMAVVSMVLLDGCDLETVMDRFGRSRSSVYRWLQTGVRLLKEQLDA